MRSIIIATANPGKFAEITSCLAGRFDRFLLAVKDPACSGVTSTRVAPVVQQAGGLNWSMSVRTPTTPASTTPPTSRTVSARKTARRRGGWVLFGEDEP